MCLIKTERGWVNLSDGMLCDNHNDVEGVFMPPSVEEARAVTGVRARNFEMNVRQYIAGEMEERHIWRAFSGDMHGAFGEKL